MNVFYERETKEFLPIEVRRNDAPVTTGIQFAITPLHQRPQAWEDALTMGGKTGVMVEALTRGDYTVWAKVQATPELPVFQATHISIR